MKSALRIFIFTICLKAAHQGYGPSWTKYLSENVAGPDCPNAILVQIMISKKCVGASLLARTSHRGVRHSLAYSDVPKNIINQ
jgi:hypothetical protein